MGPITSVCLKEAGRKIGPPPGLGKRLSLKASADPPEWMSLCLPLKDRKSMNGLLPMQGGRDSFHGVLKEPASDRRQSRRKKRRGSVEEAAETRRDAIGKRRRRDRGSDESNIVGTKNAKLKTPRISRIPAGVGIRELRRKAF
jgi:hypothetical protein